MTGYSAASPAEILRIQRSLHRSMVVKLLERRQTGLNSSDHFNDPFALNNLSSSTVLSNGDYIKDKQSTHFGTYVT